MATNAYNDSDVAGSFSSLEDNVRQNEAKQSLQIEQDCSSCGKRSYKLKACTRCWCAKYCDKTCQTSHWHQHKSECRPNPTKSLHYKEFQIDETESSFDRYSPIMSSIEDSDTEVLTPTVENKRNQDSEKRRKGSNKEPKQSSTILKIVYFSLRCVSPVLCIGVIVLTVAFMSSDKTFSGTPQDDSKSKLCIKFDVDKMKNERQSSEIYQLLGKLMKRTENDILKYCAVTPEQMQAMLELVSLVRKEKMQKKSPAPHKGFSFTPVSVHKQLIQSQRDKAVKEPTVINDHNIPMLMSDNESSIEHVRGVHVTNDSLVILHTGLYYVYAGVYFRPVSDRPAGEFEHQSWFMYIHRISLTNPQLTGTMLQIGHTVCKECRDNQETAFTGGNFYLDEGDTIQVCYSYLGVVNFIKESTFVGMMMLESGSP